MPFGCKDAQMNIGDLCPPDERRAWLNTQFKMPVKKGTIDQVGFYLSLSLENRYNTYIYASNKRQVATLWVDGDLAIKLRAGHKADFFWRAFFRFLDGIIGDRKNVDRDG